MPITLQKFRKKVGIKGEKGANAILVLDPQNSGGPRPLRSPLLSRRYMLHTLFTQIKNILLE